MWRRGPRQCRAPLIRLNAADVRFNRSLGVGGVGDCLLPCSSPFFSDDEKRFASLWVAVWAAVAALSSALTFATFLIDRPRFRYDAVLSLIVIFSSDPRVDPTRVARAVLSTSARFDPRVDPSRLDTLPRLVWACPAMSVHVNCWSTDPRVDSSRLRP